MTTEAKPARTRRSETSIKRSCAGLLIGTALTAALLVGGVIYLDNKGEHDREVSVLARTEYHKLEESVGEFCDQEQLFRAELVSNIHHGVSSPGGVSLRMAEIYYGLLNRMDIYEQQEKPFYDFYVDTVIDHGILGTGILGTSLDSGVPYVAPSLAEMRQEVCLDAIEKIIGPID